METKVASLWNRVGGGMIDLIFVVIGSAVLMFIIKLWVDFNGSDRYLTAEEAGALWKGRGLVVGLLVDGIYTIGMMASKKQATYGQQAVGIKIIKDDGSKIDYGTAIGRWLASLLSSVLLKIGFFIAIFTQNKKTLHDLLAGTVIIIDDNYQKASSQNESDGPKIYTNKGKEKESESVENDEYIYEQVYEEFHSSRRKKGMYVKLLTRHEGNAEKAEYEYIKTRVIEIKEERRERIEAAEELEKDTYRQIGLGNYKKTTLHGVECLIFDSGEGAIIIKEGKYRIYKTQKDLGKSALYYRDMGQYLNVGYIKTIDINEKCSEPKSIVIKCSRCKQKIRIKNMTGMIECPNCDKKWLHEQVE